MGVGGAGRGDDFLARGVRLAIGNVLGNRAEEQKGFLQHQTDVLAEVGNRIRPNVHAVHQNRALGHVVEAADQIHQRAFARAAVAHQADHLARRDVERDALVDLAVAVAEAHVAHRYAPFHLAHMHRVGGLGHAGDMVQNVEDALGRRGRLLRHRHDSAHGIEPTVKAADVGNRRQQHTHGDLPLRHLPDAKAPDHQQADFGHQRDAGREQRPDAVDAVVDDQVVAIRLTKAFGLALLLGKGLDHADAGNGIGQHIGHLAPDPVDFLETGAQAVAHKVDHPADKGQRHQGDQRQVRIHGKQDDSGHHDHDDVAGKVGQVQRQVNGDAVALAAHARQQVAGAFAAKIFQGEAQ